MIVRSATLGVVLALSVSGWAWGGDPRLATSPAQMPDGVPPAVREVLDPGGFEVELEDGAGLEFWLRKELPVRDSASPGLGVSFGRLEAGTLVGILQVRGTWSDYRRTPIRSGLYTLRYAIQPADGNHLGVSFYRDFLLLVPVGDDGGPTATYSHDDLVALSKKASGINHPAVLALFPVQGPASEPRLIRNEIDQWTLAVPLSPFTLGLVVEGHGEIEGY